MKPDWDKLMDDFKASTTSLVGDVDCTAEGKELCEKNDVRGYPTIKYGDPSDLKDYQGGRKYDDLKKFADENLGPSCGPEHLDLCNEEDKATIEKFLAMDDAELTKLLEDADAKVAKIEDKATKAVTKLETRISDLQTEVETQTKKKEDDLAKEKKKLGLGMMRAVSNAKKKAEEGGSKKKKSKKKGKKEL